MRPLTCRKLLSGLRFTRRGFARTLRFPTLRAARRPLRVERHTWFPHTLTSIRTLITEALVLRNCTKSETFQWCPTVFASARLVVQALCAITTRPHGFSTARLATSPRGKWLGRFTSFAFINDLDVSAVGPHLRQLLALPSKAQNVVSCWHLWNPNQIDNPVWHCSRCHLFKCTRSHSTCASSWTEAVNAWGWRFKHRPSTLVIVTAKTRNVVACWNWIARVRRSFW